MRINENVLYLKIVIMYLTLIKSSFMSPHIAYTALSGVRLLLIHFGCVGSGYRSRTHIRGVTHVKR
jgi:hypothetical protein